MTEVTKYIADDGKVFDTALECREYEIEKTVTQIKWERDIAMRTLADIGIPFGHEYKDITDNTYNDLMFLDDTYTLAEMIKDNHVKIIQIGGFTE